MTRIRLALVGLALAVALPVGGLLARALQSAQAERQIRHDAVAGRTFDEMERVLSAWLEREESRPFDAYRFYVGEGAARVRSPLSREPAEPFVLGAFQVDPDGTLHTPLRPRDEAEARRRGDWPASAEARRRAERVLAVARTLPERPRRWRDPAGDLRERLAGEPLEAAPAAEPRTSASQAKREAGRTASAYEVLDSLNRAASLREQRRQKVTRAPRSSVEEQSALASTPSPAAEADRAPAGGPGRLGYADSPGPWAGNLERARPDAAPQTVRVALDPMVGVPLEAHPGTLAVYRTVVVGEQGFRQGLIVDLAALGLALEEQVIRAGPLAGRARARFGAPDRDAAPAPDTAYLFEHRFGEPFDALTVRLELDPLEGAGDDRPLYALLGLIVVLTAAGLYAVDRLTGVAVEYAERRSNFVAAVSHELKTPLTAIRMYAEMLRDGLVANERKRSEYYGTITEESERLSRLIDNVLEFSRLEKGRRELALSAGDLAAVVREAADTLAPHAERSGFALRVEAREGLPPAAFDRDALLQILFNLVDNAIKYAASASRREIVLTVARQADGVAVGVRDFGPGVPRAQLRRVFEPFHRVESELTRQAKGTGIGLALVRELAAAMGAAVLGETPDDGGFRVRLVFRPA
ncbi:MAG: ATP-binding protein [Myxococcota bacterium]